MPKPSMIDIRRDRIRKLLRNSEGMSTAEIAQHLNKEPAFAHRQTDKRAVHYDLTTMPDAYIDRWTLMHKTHGTATAIWCVVVPPANCPKPDSA